MALVYLSRRSETIVGALALRFRGLLIGVVCLLLSAGLVFAGGGFSFGAGSGGLDRAAEGPGQTVDDGDDADGDDGDTAPAVHDGDEDADNHGDLVSQAAQMATPVAAEGAEGFKNHGAFVSCVARKLYLDHDADPAVEIVLAELTPDDCDGDDEDEVATDEVETEDPAVTENEDEWDNHGDLVSDAAQMATPVAAEGAEGFKSHGAFVSCVAKMAYGKKGVEAPTDFVLAELTPEDCDQAEEDAAASADDGPGKSAQGKGHGKGKGHGRGR
jgi:hypothetical protein